MPPSTLFQENPLMHALRVPVLNTRKKYLCGEVNHGWFEWVVTFERGCEPKQATFIGRPSWTPNASRPLMDVICWLSYDVNQWSFD